MDFDLPQHKRSHKKRIPPDELMGELNSQLERTSKKRKPSKNQLNTGRQYTYCGGTMLRTTPYIPRTQATRHLHSSKAQNDAIQQRESAHHQPEDTGQEQEQQSQDNFHVDQADERYQGWNMDDTDTETLNQLCDQISEELDAVSRPRARPSTWHRRMEKREESWEGIRNIIFECVLANEDLPDSNDCVLCGQSAFIRCFQCAPSALLCSHCDEKLHSELPLHDRQAWRGTHFKPVPPTVTVDQETLELKTIQRFWPLKLYWRCPNCKETGTLKREPANGDKRVLITCEGRFDLDDCIAVCANCNFQYGTAVSDVINIGFWPSSVSRTSTYLFSSHLLELFDVLHKFIPGTSTGGFIHSLEELSARNGRVSTINQASFLKCFEEYRYCQMELLQISRHPLLECPACYGSQHSIHVDGNRKLYRYSKVPRGIRNSYYEDMFIANNEQVDSHLKAVGYQEDNNRVSGTCGTSRFKAAKESSKTMKSLDETGLIVAGCRHVVAQKAVNMFRGELFGYTHFLHVHDIVTRKVEYFFQDVVCQYWPWCSKLNFPCPSALQMIPCLPAMHAKAHTWHCSVLWGGRWKDGSAAGSGEDMEMLFSYLSRWGLTKYMLAYRREEFLTEAAVFWNSRKIKSLPKALALRLNKANSKLLMLEGQLNSISVQSAISLEESELECLKQQIQSLAQGELHVSINSEDDREQYYLLYMQSTMAAQLSEYSTTTTSLESIITVTRSAAASSKLQDLEQKLLIDDEESKQQCLQEGRLLAIKRKLEQFQSDLEMYFLSIERKQAIIQTQATSSKQRSRMRHSISHEKSKLESCVTRYNNLVDATDSHENKTSVAEILAGEFPWSALLGKHRTVEMQRKLQAVELYNDFKRYREERKLIIAEMRNLLNYYHQSVLPAISRDIKEVDRKIHENQDVESSDAESNVTTRRYSSCSVSPGYLKGRKAFLEKSKEMAARYLISAIDMFTMSEIDVEDENTDFDNGDFVMTELMALEVESGSSTDDEFDEC